MRIVISTRITNQMLFALPFIEKLNKVQSKRFWDDGLYWKTENDTPFSKSALSPHKWSHPYALSKSVPKWRATSMSCAIMSPPFVFEFIVILMQISYSTNNIDWRVVGVTWYFRTNYL